MKDKEDILLDKLEELYEQRIYLNTIYYEYIPEKMINKAISEINKEIIRIIKDEMSDM